MSNTKPSILFVMAAPSGAGKSTIAQALLKQLPQLKFTISCTTRSPRLGEDNAVHYYFISEKEFVEKINRDEFLEWENVYQDVYYGTPKSEIERINNQGNIPLLDIDVVGALNIKKMFGKQCHTIFIQPPSIDALKERLQNRGTETEATLQKRISKAAYELSFAPEFDTVIINDDLEKAIQQTLQVIQQYIPTNTEN